MSAVVGGLERPEDTAGYTCKFAAHEHTQRKVVKIMMNADVRALSYPAVSVLPSKKDDVGAGRADTLPFRPTR